VEVCPLSIGQIGHRALGIGQWAWVIRY